MNIVTFRTDPDTDPPSVNAYADIPITAIEATVRVTKLTALTSGPIAVKWKNTGANTISGTAHDIIISLSGGTDFNFGNVIVSGRANFLRATFRGALFAGNTITMSGDASGFVRFAISPSGQAGRLEAWAMSLDLRDLE